MESMKYAPTNSFKELKLIFLPIVLKINYLILFIELILKKIVPL